MMPSTMNYFVFGGILAAFVATSYALVCHDCQVLAAESCNDPYFDDNLSECDEDSLCVKYKTIVFLRDSGYITGWKRNSSVVTRACEPKQGKTEGCIGWQNNGGVTLKCWCGTDGCNSGRSLQPTVTSAVLLPSLISLVAMLFVNGR